MKISNFEEISSFLSDNKFKKCFLVTGKNSYYKSGADKIFDKILEKKILFKYFKKNSIPEFDELKKIISLIEEFNPDLVIAIGGGAVIDYAKSASCLNSSVKKEDVIDESNLPKANFTEEEMQRHWADFVDILDNDGRKILASNLHSDVPKLTDNFTIWIELPNGTMKKEIEREKYDLMEYLKLKLNNHFIQLRITVNEATAKKFAFTPEEKYMKLREKNPAIDLLRKEFDLDI